MEIRFDMDCNALAEVVAAKVLASLQEGVNARLLNVGELAAHLQVPKSWIYDRTRVAEAAGGIPRVHVGKYVRFHLPEVLRWLREKGQPTD